MSLTKGEKFLDGLGLESVFRLILDKFYTKEEIDENINKHTFKWAIFEGETEKLDIIFYDKEQEELVVVSDEEKWDTEKHVPVGIVVVPALHDVYGTGECGVMSLVNMSLTTPDKGDGGLATDINKDENASNQSHENYGSLFYFGYTSHGLETSQNFPVQGMCDGPVQLSVTGYVTGNAQMPCDILLNAHGPACLTEKNTFYQVEISSINSGRGWVPSPYGNRGTRNPLYYEGGEKSNSLARYDGKGTTEKILELATAQTDWRTDETLKKSKDKGYYPAAEACWRFHTEGTNQGDWYLPEIGELGYLSPRLGKVTEIIDKLKETFGNDCASHINKAVQNYITSTPTSNGSVRWSSFNASLGSQSTDTNACVRAFMRIKI